MLHGLQVHATDVRSAFNSLLNPFVLTFTSVEQDGLDFHGYLQKNNSRYNQLIKVLSLYRLTMGQPRQEELLNI
ncbi:hypothetical protein prwr041_23400 [Prevotella herbatica]|uniref:Uncharacterized protein n=1 Tax=Prevotella herbatica TaxID=2801997 RepID=A0ABN6EKM0_9BACT|nr:hypothetical protein prwr041_23400 [Prevotella herbatica]